MKEALWPSYEKQLKGMPLCKRLFIQEQQVRHLGV